MNLIFFTNTFSGRLGRDGNAEGTLYFAGSGTQCSRQFGIDNRRNMFEDSLTTVSYLLLL